MFFIEIGDAERAIKARLAFFKANVMLFTIGLSLEKPIQK